MIPVHYCTIYFKMNAMMHRSTGINSKPTINNYCGKIAVVMLSYPVGRKEVLGTKIRLVCLLTVFSACASHLLTLGGMYAIARIFQTVPEAAVDTEQFFLWLCCRES